MVFSDGSVQSAKVENTLDAIDLSGDGWNLKLESWGPDKSDENIQDTMIPGTTPAYPLYKDPSNSVVTTVHFDNIALGSWKDLPATEEQLAALGVPSMDNIIGIGYYTKSFTLPDTWSDSTGAVLNLGYSQDEVTAVTVNGTTITVVDIISDQVDIGAYLSPGENTITVKLVTPMFNRAVVESMAMTPAGGMPQINGTDTVDLGLKSVVLDPYTAVKLNVEEDKPSSSEPDSSESSSDVSDSSSSSGDASGSNPGTGDGNPILPIAMLAAVSAVTFAVIRKGRKA